MLSLIGCPDRTRRCACRFLPGATCDCRAHHVRHRSNPRHLRIERRRFPISARRRLLFFRRVITISGSEAASSRHAGSYRRRAWRQTSQGRFRPALIHSIIDFRWRISVDPRRWCPRMSFSRQPLAFRCAVGRRCRYRQTEDSSDQTERPHAFSRLWRLTLYFESDIAPRQDALPGLSVAQHEAMF